MRSKDLIQAVREMFEVDPARGMAARVGSESDAEAIMAAVQRWQPYHARGRVSDSAEWHEQVCRPLQVYCREKDPL